MNVATTAAATNSTLRHSRSSLPPTNLPARRIRKRPRHSPPSHPTPQSPILAGVVACLSGQSAPHKSRLESLIASLGGVAVRDFDPLYVTHLILDRPIGNKYEYVCRNREKEFARRLHLVKSVWVERCRGEGRRVDENECALDHKEGQEEEERAKTGDDQIDGRGLPREIRHASLREACEWTALRSFPRIFFSQHFLLVGFDHGDNSRTSSIREVMSALIRRAGGTVYWSPNDFITVVVLAEEYSEHHWEDVRSFCQHHTRGPMAVTAPWILSSLYHCAIRPPPFPPFPSKDNEVVQRPAKAEHPNDSNRTTLDATLSAKKVKVQSHLFAGSIFVIVRPKPPSGTMSFEKHDMESLITAHGGLLLTKQLFGAIKMDLADASKTSTRKFHLVSTGGYAHDPTNLDPLLAQLSKLGVKIIPVTPVWIKACVGDRVRYDAQQYPLLFQPQTWPVKLLPPHRANAAFLLLSLTGFVDASRYGIIWMLKEIGAGYTDNLTSKNTHLICKHAVGKKYEKACEWGLHVVSVEWLYHVMRYGYTEGCEREFSLGGCEAALKSEGVEKDRVCSDLPSVETNDNHVVTKARETPGGGVAPNASLSTSHNDDHNHVSSAPSSRNSDKDSSVDPEASETSKKDVTPKASKSPDSVNKRLHSALQSLETFNPNTFPRRSQRRRIPIIDADYSPSLFTQQGSPPHDKDEEPEQTEQFTIRVDADVGTTFQCVGDVPISQVNDAEDIGESQVVWFAERCAR